jgi:hypothetical protein
LVQGENDQDPEGHEPMTEFHVRIGAMRSADG